MTVEKRKSIPAVALFDLIGGAKVVAANYRGYDGVSEIVFDNGIKLVMSGAQAEGFALKVWRTVEKEIALFEEL